MEQETRLQKANRICSDIKQIAQTEGVDSALRTVDALIAKIAEVENKEEDLDLKCVMYDFVKSLPNEL